MKRRAVCVFLAVYLAGCSVGPEAVSEEGVGEPLQGADAGVNTVVTVEPEEVTDGGVTPDAGLPPGLTLSVNVQGQKSEKGQLCIAVYGSADGFPSQDEKSVVRGCVSMSQRPLQVEGLVEGNTYGFSVFHDANANSTLDMTNFLGFELPAESYGFSRNAKGSFGPPSWNDARFVFSTDTAESQVELSNPM
jgi:uncharacterized protein (DUF2141 family)